MRYDVLPALTAEGKGMKSYLVVARCSLDDIPVMAFTYADTRAAAGRQRARRAADRLTWNAIQTVADRLGWDVSGPVAVVVVEMSGDAIGPGPLTPVREVYSRTFQETDTGGEG